MSVLSALANVTIFLFGASAFAQMSNNQAGDLLGLSAGRYLGSAINLNIIRETSCGQYLKTDIDYETETKSDIVKTVPEKYRSGIGRELMAMISEVGPATKKKNKALFQDWLNKREVTRDVCAHFIGSLFGQHTANAKAYKDTVAQVCTPNCFR